MTGFRIIIFRRWFTENNKKMFLNTNATWREWLSSESKEWKIYGLALSLQLISNVTPSFRRPRQNIAPKKGSARAARLFFLHSTNQIISLWRRGCRYRPYCVSLWNRALTSKVQTIDYLSSVESCFNKPFYSCVLSCLAFEWKWGWS